MRNDPTDFSQFVKWEVSAEVIDFKRAYVDMTAEPGKPLTGDTLAGLLLSQIVYYHLPNRRARKPHQLDVEKGGYWWLVRKRTDWWEECRILPNRYDAKIKLLQERGLVVVELMKYNGTPVHHIRLDYEGFMAKWDAIISGLPVTTVHNQSQPETAVDGTNPILADGESPILATDGNGIISANGENPILATDGNDTILANDEIDLIRDRVKTGDMIMIPLELSTVWGATKGELELQMTRATFNTWLKDTTLLAVCKPTQDEPDAKAVMVVTVRNDYAKDWLGNRLKETILRTAGDIMRDEVELDGCELDVVFVVATETPQPARRKSAKVHRNGNGRNQPTPTQLNHDPDYQELSI